MAITISDTTPRVQYTATSGQTAFTVSFEFFVNADLKVYNGSSLLTYAASPSNGTEYSVTGAGVTGGGTVTLGSGGATLNDVITIYRDMAISRATDFPTSGAFQIASLNDELDKLTAMVQQVETDAKYSPKFSEVTSTGFDLTFPELVASKVISVNSAGTALEAAHSIVDVSTVATVVDEIALLGVAGVITDMGILGTADVVTDMNVLATADVVADMNTLASADFVTDLNVLATSDIVTDMNLLATSANVTAMGLLGNSATVTDLGILGTSGIVTDLDLLATSANVTAMGVLGTSANVTAMGVLGTSGNVTAMGLLGVAGVVTDMGILGTSAVVTDLDILGTSAVVTDLDILGTSANVTAMATVATNIAGVNSFAERYRVASSDPGSDLDEGDLVFNTTSNLLKYYTGSAWSAITTDTDVKVLVSSNDTTAGYLNGKLVAGTGISFTENSDGSNETLTITNTGDDPTALAIALG
jgi:hypothetical protein